MVETARQSLDHAQAALDAARAAGGGADDRFVLHLAVFALAVFVGAYLVRPTAPALRGPLTALAIAISAVVVVGALISVGADASVVGEDGPLWARLFGFVALILASASMFGGFLATQRMLSARRKEGLTR